ncbi:hypothetical protein J2S90_002478 [Arthrobacter bambusae]|uniref:Uncharacterized protein n=1 Tax=Arthrobacter bambusae TaxID=1338426 RepID=A0AAW8DI74_9MICC|nr:hypothetical protein [Arthrobacter bambusae]MDQ0127411.1 hypothetical protein [Arthrobacter bambusae]MDQ0178753.1 hypothetical protein [Arthrobacter bambusae]
MARKPEVEMTLTITPPLPAAVMWRAASRAPTNTPREFTAKTSPQKESLILSSGTLGKMPALLTQMSIPPSRAAATCATAATDRVLVTSIRMRQVTTA